MKYKFSEGDIVQVKEREMIAKSLDSSHMHDGCLFAKQMWDHCGEKFTVIKIVKNIFDERECKIYNADAPLYILNNAICNGEVDSFKQRCDHCCFLLWHEIWLEKAN